MKSFIRRSFFLFVFIVIVSPVKSHASHCAGAELLFQWLHDSTYQLYYKFYRDCTGISEASSVQVCIGNTCNSYTNSYTMDKVTALIPPGVLNGTELAAGLLCPGVHTTCGTPAGSIPGYREWWYTVNVTLPSKCNYWTFIVNQNARSVAITNFANPGSQSLTVEATLDNLDAQGDTSPFFSVKPVPYTCSGISTTYNNGAYDINNDSMAFTMVLPFGGGGCSGATTIQFSSASPAYNLTNNPLQTNNTFSLNASTGLMSFTPSITQVAAIAMRVDEYRNQIKIGSVMRDMQLVVLACSGPLPPTTGNPFNVNGGVFSTSPDSNIIAFEGINMNFKIASSIQPSTAGITMMSDNASTAIGSTFTVPPYYGIGTDTGVFSWTPGLSDSGDHYVTFTAQDSCTGVSPFLVSTTYQLRIHVITVNASSSCNSFAVGKNFDTSDVGRFIIGTDTFGTIYSHLSNPAAVNSYTFHPDTITLLIDSTYHLQEAGIINTIHDADAKVTLFIDFNGNQQFDIPQERVWTAYQEAFYSYIVDTSITIPSTAVIDSPIMMRLILNNDTGASAASDSACGPYISGETEDFIVIFRNATASIRNLVNDKHINFFPNPSSGKFTMRLSSTYGVKELQLNVLSVTGQKVMSKEFKDISRRFSTGIDMGNMPKGLYFIETNADGDRQLGKMVIE